MCARCTCPERRCPLYGGVLYMEVLFKGVTLNIEPEAVVELNAAELTKTLWVWF